MPTIVTFILIIASFTIASKYELKSIMKQPIKMIAPAINQNNAPSNDQTDSLQSIQKKDSIGTSSDSASPLLLKRLPTLPKEVSVVLLSRFQVNLTIPKGV